MSSFEFMSRRKALALGAGVAAASCFPLGAVAAARRQVVVELFTSQGCSSCPPADAFLDDLRNKPEVIAISYHVDYWDYLGWKDTLGKPENSQRQYDYARARGDMDVYTPQMIVNGDRHLVGSDRGAVLEAIATARADAAATSLAITDTAMEFVVDMGSGASPGEVMLWLMPVVPRVSVKILKGEIAGQEITYRNVVRSILPAGMWEGGTKTVKLPKEGVLTGGSKACVALLQRGKAGSILAAATWGDFSA